MTFFIVFLKSSYRSESSCDLELEVGVERFAVCKQFCSHSNNFLVLCKHHSRLVIPCSNPSNLEDHIVVPIEELEARNPIIVVDVNLLDSRIPNHHVREVLFILISLLISSSIAHDEAERIS